MSTLVTGAALVAASVALVSYALLADAAPRISKERRTGGVAGPAVPLHRVLFRGFVAYVDRFMSSSGWKPFRASELEMADISRPASTVVAWIVMAAGGAFGVGFLVGRSIWVGLALAVLMPVGAKVVLRIRAGKRRALFARQLDGVLQMLASSLRAGQSFTQALSSCARDTSSPMSDELARVVNENRLGRDLISAMEETAERMDCEDFVWLAEAVAVTRDSGGNLNEIIERVGETIRERTEIREKVHAYSSEGRMSAYVLMGLPIVVAAGYSVISPGYLGPLFTDALGRALLGVSAVLFTISYFWMRAIADVKF
jgi:tight adherence protein B